MEIDCFRLSEILEDYSKAKGQALLVFQPCWEHFADELKQEAVDFYRDKMPVEIVNSLVTGQMRIIKYPNFDLALEDASSYFPNVEAIEDINPNYRIDVFIIDEHGRTCWTNK